MIEAASTYKTIDKYLFEEIDKYKSAYNSCNKYEQIHYKTYLRKYEWQFKNKKDFLKWYLQIII